MIIIITRILSNVRIVKTYLVQEKTYRLEFLDEEIFIDEKEK